MKSVSTIYVFVLAVVAVPLTVFGITRWYETNVQRLPVLGPENHVVGDFRFTDQTGEMVDNKSWKGKIIVADFFFTSCPAICPKVAFQLKRVQAYADEKIL